MNSKIVRFLFILSFTVLFSFRTFAQQPDIVNENREFSDYRVIQYISGTGPGPKNIMDLDNNGDILLACISGKTNEQLRAEGIEFAESQIQLLKSYRLLRKDGGILQTTFPIIDEDKTQRLRKYTKAIAFKLTESLRLDVAKLTGLLKSIHRENNTYSILFSYVIDGLIWTRFSEKGLTKEREITTETPFWDGEVWAIYPPRDFSSGTNSISDQGISLNVNWSEQTIPKMKPFVSDWKNLLKMFEDYVEKGKVEDQNAIEVFAPFNLFDSSGCFTIPIIEEKEGNPLYDISSSISEILSGRVTELVDLGELQESFGFRDEEQTLIIVYHELMWDLIDNLEETGLIKKPVAFADPEKAKPEDIADLIFIVKGNN